MSRTLYLSPPSFDGFDGGAGARYQARREVTSYWYPTWLAQPAALVAELASLLDCPPHDIDVPKCLAIAKDFDHVIINTSTPSLKNDCKVAEAIKAQKPDTKIGFVGAHTMVLPTETLKASPAIDWVGRKEFDFTCKEVAEGRDLATIAGLSYKDKDGKIKHNPEREMIQDMDTLPWVADVYKRDLRDRKIFHRLPAASLHQHVHRPRLPGAMHLLPLAADHRRTQISRPLAAERRRRNGLHEENVSRRCRNFSSTTTRSRRTCRAPAKSPRNSRRSACTGRCNSRANLDYDTIKSFKDNGLRLFLVGYESGNDDILTRIKKGVTMDEMRRFTKACHQAGVVIHGTFILGLPVETKQTIENTIRFREGTRRVQPCRSRWPRRIRARSFTKWPSKTAGS